jgi:hypothetical protein
MSDRMELIGQRFGRLTVESFAWVDPAYVALNHAIA